MPIRRVLTILLLLLGGLLLGNLAGCGGDKDQTTTGVEPPATVSSSAAGATNGEAPADNSTGSTGGADGDNGGDQPGQEEGAGGDPEDEGRGPEKPAPRSDKPWTKLANAPVGADQTYTEQVGAKFCVGINLLTTPRDGVTVKIVGVTTSPKGRIDVNGGSCGGRPACEGYTFTPENGTCSVPVTPRRSDPTGDVGTRLTLSGDVYCADGAKSSCEAWLEDAGGDSDQRFVTLYLPPGSEESPSPSPSPSDSENPDD